MKKVLMLLVLSSYFSFFANAGNEKPIKNGENPEQVTSDVSAKVKLAKRTIKESILSNADASTAVAHIDSGGGKKGTNTGCGSGAGTCAATPKPDTTPAPGPSKPKPNQVNGDDGFDGFDGF
jgi:hypothetical protein